MALTAGQQPAHSRPGRSTMNGSSHDTDASPASSGGTLRKGQVDQLDIRRQQAFRVLAAGSQFCVLVRVAQIGQVHFIELQIRTASPGKAAMAC